MAIEEYRARAERFGQERDRLTRQWNLVGNVRLVAFVAAAALLVWGIVQGATALWLGGLAVLGAFVALVVYHNIVGRQRRRFEELYRINTEAIARAERRWDDIPLRHTIAPEPGDPYTGDLDIFGRASLFHLIETVGTYMGEATLARWLRYPASPATIRARQEAVAELAPMLDVRDELLVRGRLMGDEKPDPAPFLAWAEAGPLLPRKPWVRVWAYVSVALFWLLVAAHATGLVPYPLWFLVGAANILFTLSVGREISHTIEHVSAGEQGFKHYAAAFELLSGTPFQSAEMRRLQGNLSAGGARARDALRRLHRIVTFAIPESSILYLFIEAATMWEVHHLVVLEGWQRRFGSHARLWLDTLGEAEALSALATLSHGNAGWAFPSVEEDAQSFTASNLGHPLIAPTVRVDNDVEVGPPGTFLLVTGSNMSGKSTLLRAIGVNIVLAQAGGPVCAAALTMPPVRLWTVMRVEDSLERGVSYFMAELQRLKLVVDAARQAPPDGGVDRRLFYLLDEILHGTNTRERQIAARRVIMYLVSTGALGAVSTHDLTLAEDPQVAAAARMVHFVETVREGDGTHAPTMTFDYRLRPGLATSTNALKLMEIVFGPGEV
jgi:ABC-type multidrug transport system fused ATPase/permease subunit